MTDFSPITAAAIPSEKHAATLRGLLERLGKTRDANAGPRGRTDRPQVELLPRIG